MEQIDIWSKGEVVQYLQGLLQTGRVKDCTNLKIKQGYLRAFYPECLQDWASRSRADNVRTSPTAYSAPSVYYWPECQKDCPKYSQTKDFVASLISDVPRSVKLPSSGTYVDQNRIQELRIIKNRAFDLTKLIRFCEELNLCHSNGAILAVPMLVRAILDHIPPVFNQTSFVQVANNYKGTKSFKKSMLHLENSSRNIADSFLHTQIRSKESLPTETQVNFKNDLDVLLQEIVRILKK